MATSILIIALLGFLLYQPSCIVGDSVQDAKDQLDILKQDILGRIIEADTGFNVSIVEFHEYTNAAISSAEEDVQVQRSTVEDQLDDLKESSQNSTYDATVCFQSVVTINFLLEMTHSAINLTVSESTASAEGIYSSSAYLVDITYNVITQAESQLLTCNDEECGSAILDDIAGYAIQLPALINVVVLDAKASFEVLQNATQNALNNVVDDYGLATNAIILDIAKCVETAQGGSE